MRGIQFVESLDGEDNAIVDPSALLTLEGKPVNEFVDRELPVAVLTKGKAHAVNTADFEKLSNDMEALKNKALEDKERIRLLETKIVEARTSNSSTMYTYIFQIL